MSSICGDCGLQHPAPVISNRYNRECLNLQLRELGKAVKPVCPDCDKNIEAVQNCHARVKALKDCLRQIAESEDTTNMTAEQILMGYNAHKDLARATLSGIRITK